VQKATHYVSYYVAAHHRNGLRSIASLQAGEPDASESLRCEALKTFITTHRGVQVGENFVEMPDNRRTAKWPKLQSALELCRRTSATLLIAELGTLASNETFSELLLKSGVSFYCLDQPFVNQTILDALSKYAQVQKKLHGQLIREGLKMTSAKSGNPNAAEVISKVNKPKIDAAIVFALVLQQIIQDYRRKGYSQRQMVKALNDEGFTAPEGGKWVLSQLQKVLDRVRLNEVAAEVRPLLEMLITEKRSSAEIAETLNAKGIISLKKDCWDEAQAKKLEERIKQITEITLVNRFVLNFLPLLHEYRRQGLPPTQMLQHLCQAGLPIRQQLTPSAA